MIDNSRRFEVGPDPFGRRWTVEYRWLQNGISIRHSDTVDVKFQLFRGEDVEEKIIALRHPVLLELSRKLNRPLTDPWCMKLAALHLQEMIETDRDMEKILVTPSLSDLERHAVALDQPQPVRR
jgi:hypothetical protein